MDILKFMYIFKISKTGKMYCFLIDYYLVYVYFLCQFVLIFFLILVVTNIYIYSYEENYN
jgi:hypothetical protein